MTWKHTECHLLKTNDALWEGSGGRLINLTKAQSLSTELQADGSNLLLQLAAL